MLTEKPAATNDLSASPKDIGVVSENSSLRPAIEPLAPRRETAALVVGQPYPPPSQLLPENAVLLHQILDHLLLLAVEPSGQRNE